MWPSRDTIGDVLWLWVVVIVALIGAVVVIGVGRSEPMAEVYDDRPDTTIPTGRPLTAEDLRDVRFTTAVRGYRMDEVDSLLERLQADLLTRERHDLEARDLVRRTSAKLPASNGETSPRVDTLSDSDPQQSASEQTTSQPPGTAMDGAAGTEATSVRGADHHAVPSPPTQPRSPEPPT